MRTKTTSALHIFPHTIALFSGVFGGLVRSNWFHGSLDPVYFPDDNSEDNNSLLIELFRQFFAYLLRSGLL